MILRGKATPTRFPTNSAYTPMDNTPLHSISSVCHPWVGCTREHEKGMISRQQLGWGNSHTVEREKQDKVDRKVGEQQREENITNK